MKKLVVEVGGELLTVSDIVNRYGLERDTVLARIRKGLDVTAPVALRNKKTCVVCGNDFLCPPSGKKTCSSVCGSAYRRYQTGSHRMSYTRLYGVWCHMKSRCSSENNNPNTAYYAKRGITVCDAWQQFAKFQEWAVENGYTENLEIDRIDNDKGYCPENCRWATRSQQCLNKRKYDRARKTSQFKGVARANSKWRASISLDGNTRYLGVFENESEAARAYDRAAVEIHGEFACLNFKEEVASS